MSLEIKQCLEVPSLPSIVGSRVRLTVVSPPRISKCSWSEISFKAIVMNVGSSEDPRYILSVNPADPVLAHLVDTIQMTDGWADPLSLTINIKVQDEERYFTTMDVVTAQDIGGEYDNIMVGRLTAIEAL